MNRKPRLLVLILLVSALLVGVAGCGGDDSNGGGGDSASNGGGGGELAPVRLAISSWPGFGALFVADEKGYFKEEGLKVELDLVEDQTNRVQAMQSGEKDGAGMTADTWVRWLAEGVDAQQVLATDASKGGDGIVAKKEIASIADLKGVEVGVSAGSTAAFLLGYVLDQEGLSLDDVKQADMSPADAGAAFASGKIPAAATWEPWLTKANQMPDGHVLASTKDYPVVITTVALLRDFIDKNPDSVQALVNGVGKAIDFMRANPGEAAAIIGKKVGLKPDEVQASFKTLELYGLKENKKLFGTPDAPGTIFDVVDAAGKIWTETGTIDEAPDPASGINGKFVNDGS
ncbi:MAG TPA: ABC transporter substrate-binding protein [Thermoleophilaceae bacterium]|nr:ABC transporter substrate-binding protein [Thermoleophilaceae bacterium]